MGLRAKFHEFSTLVKGHQIKKCDFRSSFTVLVVVKGQMGEVIWVKVNSYVGQGQHETRAGGLTSTSSCILWALAGAVGPDVS